MMNWFYLRLDCPGKHEKRCKLSKNLKSVGKYLLLMISGSLITILALISNLDFFITDVRDYLNNTKSIFGLSKDTYILIFDVLFLFIGCFIFWIGTLIKKICKC